MIEQFKPVHIHKQLKAATVYTYTETQICSETI